MKILKVQCPAMVCAEGFLESIVDDEDFYRLCKWRWSALIKYTTRGIYVRAFRGTRINGKRISVYMHREIFEKAHGPIPSDMTIDHRFHGEYGGLDNRRSNLRLATSSQQRANSLKRNGSSTGFKGIARVSTATECWQACIMVDGKNRYLGTFKSQIDAAKAYDLEAVSAFGEFAQTNFGIAAS